MDRRRFLRVSLGAGGALALGGAACDDPPPPNVSPKGPMPATAAPPSPSRPSLEDSPGLPDGLDPSDFVMYSKTPLTLETRRSRMGSGVITPAGLLFVRNNLPIPRPEIVERGDAWELEFVGVRAPRTLTLGELKKLGLVTVATVLQCSGNGRRYFPHGASGSPWGTGAAGCVLWTGVPVRAVTAALGGVAPKMKYLTARGGEVLPELPKEIPPDRFLVERSIPREKGLDDCILAWEMNGAPLPVTHGGPLRLIVPGYYGINNIKYVRRLAFTPVESQAKIQQTSYRVRPVGEGGSPDQPSMYRMQIKSWINGPGAENRPVLAGKVVFHGVAFSGERRVERVEVSLDAGKSWSNAPLIGPDLGKNAWRQFKFDAELKVGTHRIASRATDEAGAVQPPDRVENERGYANNSWKDHTLEVQVVRVLPEIVPELGPVPDVSERGPVVLSEAGQRGKDSFALANPPCGTCHTLTDAQANMKIGPDFEALQPDRAKVLNALNQGVGAMPPYKDRLTAAQIEDLATYVMEASR